MSKNRSWAKYERRLQPLLLEVIVDWQLGLLQGQEGGHSTVTPSPPRAPMLLPHRN